MELFNGYKLIKEDSGYTVILYLNESLVEFAEEIVNVNGVKLKKIDRTIIDYVKTRFPNIKINSIKIMIGTLLICSISLQHPQISSAVNITSSVYYTVKSGDTLWSIAQKNNTTVDLLKKLNNLSSDKISSGQKIILKTSTAVQVPITTASTNITYYIVKSGDTLWSISEKNNVTVDDLKKANNLSVNTISIGQNLIIPSKAPAAINPVTQSNQPQTSTVPQIQTQNTQAVYYTVKAGDTLWSIAQKYNISVDILKNLNKLSTSVISIGQTLLVSQGSATQNTAPLAQSQTTTSTPPAAPTQAVYYTVKSGDTLFSIAQKYNISIDILKSLNKLSTSIISIGQKLLVSQGSVTQNTAPLAQPQTTTNTPPTAPAQAVYYTVKSGDTLFSIAQKYNISIDILKNLNKLSTSIISIGQKLLVSQGSTTQNTAPLAQPQATTNTPPAAPAQNTNASTQPVQTVYYTVKTGDTLWSIAKGNNITLDSLKKLNNLSSEVILVGQKLIISQNSSAAASTVSETSNIIWQQLADIQENLTTAVYYDITKPSSLAWTPASLEQILYYINPQNFVNDSYGKYQFLILNYTNGIAINELNNILSGKGVLEGKGDIFQQAALTNNVSQAYLVSHALLETGSGTSALSKGILVTEVDGKPVEPKIVYNVFGIYAFDTDPDKYGSEYAYKQGWFSVDAAILGGAKWISSNYINNTLYKQNTLYKMRWNPLNPGTHQYATDIAWAYKQTFNIKNILDNLSNAVLTFDIPK